MQRNLPASVVLDSSQNPSKQFKRIHFCNKNFAKNSNGFGGRSLANNDRPLNNDGTTVASIYCRIGSLLRSHLFFLADDGGAAAVASLVPDLLLLLILLFCSLFAADSLVELFVTVVDFSSFDLTFLQMFLLRFQQR
ncbi:hypothetical protein DERF_014329 [Dermatophagoides farinae]|uniref:Uncharacterized protein n=1 Tax=Dermatophagoides farinae TaxID=6954 RepID=A0A922HM02_DERFA|nr:hypothetical protein DERF_014329 [Dermatophagoides farinae]